MSSDMITSQISKEVLNSSSTVKSTQINQAENRQDMAVKAGNTLPPEASSEKVSSEELQQAVAQLNDHVQKIQRDLQFSVDDSSGQTVVKVLNSETQEVVRQMPSDEALRISRNIQDVLEDTSGLIFETSA